MMPTRPFSFCLRKSIPLQTLIIEEARGEPQSINVLRTLGPCPPLPGIILLEAALQEMNSREQEIKEAAAQGLRL